MTKSPVSFRGFETLARLKPGVSLEQARADLTTAAAGLAAAPPLDQGVGVAIEKIVRHPRRER